MKEKPMNKENWFEEMQRKYEETLIICARCEERTNNRTQGHYWAYCKVTRTIRDFHMCCPNNCELEKAND